MKTDASTLPHFRRTMHQVETQIEIQVDLGALVLPWKTVTRTKLNEILADQICWTFRSRGKINSDELFCGKCCLKCISLASTNGNIRTIAWQLAFQKKNVKR